ncbi:MAG: 23S rRNA (pseudouridine(1915)-N(3))-methyltransferase RlmH, partial [Tissierellia bacterium]|nr:23S rRNA (pseudouridine(1915)-N(3))-methyltransferase RlmH [Tissierellia bacterium]
MNINIITIGTIKEKYFTDAIKEYTKRLKRYTNLKILELPEEKLGQNSSEKNIEQTLDKEADNILSKIGERDYVIVLAIEGKNISSEQLAETIKDKQVEGYNTFTFIIGSSYGLH